MTDLQKNATKGLVNFIRVDVKQIMPLKTSEESSLTESMYYYSFIFPFLIFKVKQRCRVTVVEQVCLLVNDDVEVKVDHRLDLIRKRTPMKRKFDVFKVRYNRQQTMINKSKRSNVRKAHRIFERTKRKIRVKNENQRQN